MKLELFIGLIVLLLAANIYYEGKIMNFLKTYQKHYKIAIIAFVGLCVYLYIKRSPQNAHTFFSNAHGYIKYLPIDRNTTSVITPFVDFTGKALGDSINSNYNGNSQEIYNNKFNNLTAQQKKILNNSRTTKRSVSETKKKYVASSQNWQCKHCQKKLPAWFEVDHVMKLEYGGSNNVDNLEALCRDCHGKKTALENL